MGWRLKECLEQEVGPTHREPICARHAGEPWFPSRTLQKARGHCISREVRSEYDQHRTQMSGPSRHAPPAHLLPPGHLVTYLLSMRANGTLRPGETLHIGREKSQGPHQVGALLQPASPTRSMSRKDLRP